MNPLDFEYWLKAGMIIGAIVVPVYLRLTPKGGTKYTIGEMCGFSFIGAMAGFLAALGIVLVAGALGVKMR